MNCSLSSSSVCRSARTFSHASRFSRVSHPRPIRAIARSVSAEMHSGFYQLRKHCPMNIRRINPPRERDEAVMKDVQRIDGIWNDCRNRFGANGPFLFGAFSGADCMYAPVVTRVRSFSLPVSDVSKAYMDAVLNHPAFLEWEAASKVEPWTNPNSEVD